MLINYQDLVYSQFHFTVFICECFSPLVPFFDYLVCFVFVCLRFM